MNDLISSLNNLYDNNEAGLPSPKTTGLPTPKGAMPTPSPLSTAGLPSVKGAMPTPSPLGAGLPSPKGSAGYGNLPSPKPEADWMGAPNDDLMGAPRNSNRTMISNGLDMAGIQAPISSPSMPAQPLGGSLGGAVRKNTVALSSIDFDRSYSSQEIPAVPLHASGTEQVRMGDADLNTRNPEDSALNIPKLKMNGPEPTVKTGYQEPAAFNPTHDINEDSGLPLMDDPLSLMGGGDSIFDSPKSTAPQRKPSTSIPKDKMDLFGALGNAIKMPEDATPIPQAMRASAQTPNKSADDATPIPQSMRMSMAGMNAISAPGGEVRELGGDLIEADEEEEGEELVFDINSIKSDEKTAARALAAAKANTEADKKVELKFWQNKIFILCVVGVVLLGLIAFALANFVVTAKTVTDDELSYIPAQRDVEVNWNILRADSLYNYERFYRNSKEKISNMEAGTAERADIQGQILTSIVLGMVRFPEKFKPEIEIIDASTTALSESCNTDWCNFGLWAWGELRNNEDLKTKFESKLPTSGELATLKPIVQAAARYATWEPENQPYETYEKYGKDILALLPDTMSFETWAIGAWIKASTLARLGAHREGLKVLEPLTLDETKNFTGILSLQAALYIATDNAESALKSAERILNTTAIALEEKQNALNLKLIAESSIDTWDVFQKKLIEFGKTYGNDATAADTLAQACLYTNIAENCRIVVQGLSDVKPNNIPLRNAYMHIFMASIGYKNIMRPDMHINKNLLTQLVNTADSAIKADPKDIEIWKHKLLASFAAGDYDAARKAVDEVERGEKKEWFGRYLRTIMPYADADFEQQIEISNTLKQSANVVHSAMDSIALAHALNYVDESIVALEVLNRAAQIHPENTIVLDALFDLAVALGNKEITERVAQSLNHRKALMTHHEFEYAKLIELRGDPNAALEHMLTLIGKDPNNSVYLSYIGELFFKQKQCESAMPYFEQSLEIDPNNAAARFYRGRCYFNSHRFEEALNEFNEASTQDEGNLLYILWNGRCYAGMNQIMEAERSFTTVIDAYSAQVPGQQMHDPVNLPEAYFHRAEIRKMQNRRTDARSDYKDALNLSPENVEYLSGYAIYLYENGNLEDCVSHVTQIENIAGDHADPRLFFVRGQAYLKQNRRDEAIRDLEHALKLGFGDMHDSGIIGVREPAEIYESLGYLYRDLGKRDQARKALMTFLEKSTSLSDRTRKEIQSQIDKI